MTQWLLLRVQYSLKRSVFEHLRWTEREFKVTTSSKKEVVGLLVLGFCLVEVLTGSEEAIEGHSEGCPVRNEEKKRKKKKKKKKKAPAVQTLSCCK